MALARSGVPVKGALCLLEVVRLGVKFDLFFHVYYPLYIQFHNEPNRSLICNSHSTHHVCTHVRTLRLPLIQSISESDILLLSRISPLTANVHTFQRIRGAIDRSISEAEDLARQRSVALANRASATGSANKTRRPSSRSRNNNDDENPSQGPDPEFFEAAFVIDDDEVDDVNGNTGTNASDDKSVPTIMVEGPDGQRGAADSDGKDMPKSTETKKDGKDAVAKPAKSATPSSELPVEIRQKLRKLEKLESSYPGESYM